MLETFKRYYNFIIWILKNSVFKYRGLAFLIIVAGVMGVVFQIKIFALIIYYARKFSSGDSIVLLDYVINPRESWKLLIAFSTGISLLLMFSYLCAYMSYRLSLKLARKFETVCAEIVFKLLMSNHIVELPSDKNAAKEKYILRLVRGDATWGYRFLISLMSMVVPALTLLVALATLFYLEMLLSSVIIIFIGLFAIIQLKINRKATTFTLDYERTSPLALVEMRSLLNKIKYGFNTRDDCISTEKVLSSGGIKKQQDAFFGRYNIVRQSAFASGIFLSVTLGLTLLFMGTSIIIDGHGWERLLVYLVALRYALTNMQTVFSNITGVNRYYPQVSRIFTFIKSFEQNKPTDTALPDEYQVKLPQPFIQQSDNELLLRKGMRVAMVTAIRPNRYTLASLAKLLLNDTGSLYRPVVYSMRFATTQHSSPDVSLNELLQLDSAAGFDQLQGYFHNKDIYKDAMNTLTTYLDKPLTDKKWDNIADSLKLVLSLIAASRNSCRWVVVDEKSLRQLAAEEQSFYLNMLKNKILVIVFNSNLDGVGNFNEHAVAVANENELLGIGNIKWFTPLKDYIKELLNLVDKDLFEQGLDELDEDE
jgi:ABC-type multidrug transport system fused ATPase/permease subunit